MIAALYYDNTPEARQKVFTAALASGRQLGRLVAFICDTGAFLMTKREVRRFFAGGGLSSELSEAFASGPRGRLLVSIGPIVGFVSADNVKAAVSQPWEPCPACRSAA